MKLTIKQKSENAIKWLKALLSGRYPQGSDQLGDKESGYCCWGVACRILLPSYKKTDGWDDRIAPLIGYIDENENGPLSFKVRKDYYDEYYGRETYCDVGSNLAELNDDLHLTFKEIATILIVRAKDLFESGVAKEIRKWYNNDPVVKKKIDNIYKVFSDKSLEYQITLEDYKYA